MAGADSSQKLREPRWPRAPAVPVALAMGAGIILDWRLAISWPVWLTLIAIAIGLEGVSAWGLHSRGRFFECAAGGLVLLLAAGVGGVRHHADWAWRRDDNVASYLTSAGSPARLVGRVDSALVIDEAERSSSAPTWTQVDRTVATVRCETLGDSTHPLPASGLVRLEVTGHLIGPRVGDRLEIIGLLQRPSGPRNPGGFDYATWLRRRGIDATLRVEHPDHARIIRSEYTCRDRLSQWRDGLRQEIEWLCIQRLDSAETPLAISLLLGDRSGLDPLIADQFAVSGTMHVLAISGMHVGILAGLVHLICRLMKTGLVTTTVVLLVSVLGYALLTDQQPSVVRAAVLATVVLAGRAAGRDAGGYQSLALCALAIMLYQPMDLFDPGAQLSFLAVLAIIWSGRWQRQWETRREADVVLDAAPSRLGTLWTGLCSFVRQAYVLTGAIWLCTLPLTAWHFNICSPIGLVVNVLLVPVSVAMLAAGYSLVLLGLAHPLLAIPPAVVFSGLLQFMLWVVDLSAGTPLGHLWVPAPVGWWLAGFYLLLAGAMRFIPIPVRPGPAWRTLLVWTIGGLLLPFQPDRPHGLRMTFLSLGHGCSVLIEMPGGRTLLFDAGSFIDGRRAELAIASALWAHGGERIDAAIVSHADVDHFNGLPGLVGKLPIGSVLLSASSLDFRQEAVVDLCESVVGRGVPLRCVQAGDKLKLDDTVALEILHPEGGFRDSEDNANSVVLRVEYAGRRLLLTGDLEGAGLACLLEQSPQAVDVLMSPHHGSRVANPPALGEWATPRHVVTSTAEADAVVQLRDRYAEEVTLWSTANSGAVEVTISPQGDLRVTPFVR